MLVLPDERVIDESWEIMQWALHQHDPEGWLGVSDAYLLAAAPLIDINDGCFKSALDGYKYADSDTSRAAYRAQGEDFLQSLEARLKMTHYLLADDQSIADAALFPFIRQFAGVDKDWFEQSPYPALRLWLTGMVNSTRFAAVMQKQAIWQENPKS